MGECTYGGGCCCCGDCARPKADPFEVWEVDYDDRV